MENISKRNSVILVTLILLSLEMTLFTYSGYAFLNQIVRILWSIVFLGTVACSSILSRQVNHNWIIKFYFISNFLMIMVIAISPEIYNYIHLISLLIGLLIYPYKKQPITKKIITVFPFLFFSTILTLLILASSIGFIKTTVIFITENSISNEMLILEYHDLGATGGNYSLVMQKNIISNVLIYKATQINDLERMPENITWIDRNTYSIDGVKQRLK